MTILLRRLCATLVCVAFSVLSSAQGAEPLRCDLGGSELIITQDGKASLLLEGELKNADPVPVAILGYPSGLKVLPKGAEPSDVPGKGFAVEFQNGARAEYEIEILEDAAIIKLVKIDSEEEPKEALFFNVAVPSKDQPTGWINTSTLPNGRRVGVMTASINTLPLSATNRAAHGDRDGCSHTFARQVVGGSSVAEFAAASTRPQDDGWTYQGRSFDAPLDLSGCASLRARVFGDGKREEFKIQLGGASGHRDDYITVDFNGWKICELDHPALNDITYDDVRNLFFYYNSMPGEESVRTLIDWVDVVWKNPDGSERTLRLEDFNNPNSPLWGVRQQTLYAKTVASHGLYPATCALVSTSSEKWASTIQNVQKRAGLPSPTPGGAWRGTSPWIHENYFFLTSFSTKEYDKALEFAKRGGFRQILLEQNSWCQSTGRYQVKESNFPGGFPTLKATIDKFGAEGIRFGLHLLGASVDSNDPYLTPIPDKRFVTDISSSLADELPEEGSVVVLSDDATRFPTGENPYMGSGQVIKIDDELIEYGATEEKNLTGCHRGLYGTKPVAHKKGSEVRHFTRAYGYHLPDLDTDFIDEIAGNFAALANKLPIDMIYFDGSELLQRPGEGSDHWYYNARLHKAFYDKLSNKNILFQGSSCSPYSWHMIARNASADGHDDLKAYLEERSGGFSNEHPADSWLDVGWYYAYDKNATPDMYEYCLGATIAYDASFSFQTSVSAASAHPFIGEILDMIRAYQELRLSDRIPEELRAEFELDKRLSGRKTVEERRELLGLRKEFHLEEDVNGNLSFRRVVYPEWQNVCSATDSLGGTTASDAREENGGYVWNFEINRPGRIGLQTHFTLAEVGSGEVKVSNPRVSIFKDGGTAPIGTIKCDCELSKGQYVFSLPGFPMTKYGAPLTEPEKVGAEQSIRLEPGRYVARFEVEEGSKAPVRVRIPLYTDEVYAVPK